MENVPYPHLVFVHGKNYENQVFYDVVSEMKTHFKRENLEFKIGTPVFKSTNYPDWLITILSTELCLWNPVTLQSINLPVLLELKSAKCIRHVFLTKTPDHLDSLILLWTKDPHALLFCNVNGDDGRSWTHKDYAEELAVLGGDKTLEFDDWFHLPVGLDDDTIFMFSFRKNIMVKIETFIPLMVTPVTPMLHSYDLPGPSYFHKYHYVACCGDLFVILRKFSRVQGGIDGVMVFKLDFSNMLWNIVDSCPNVAFFISGDQSIVFPVASTNSSMMGNRVYFTGFFDDEEVAHTKALYTYHIEQKKLKVSLLAIPDNASHPYWIQVPDTRALEKAEDYCNESNDEEYFLTKRNNNDELLISDINNHGEDPKTILSDLPVEILRVISSHLTNPIDYLSFRATNKFCSSIGSAKQWRNILGNDDDNDDGEKKSDSPWLMAPSLLNKRVYSMVDPFSRNKYYTIISEALEKYPTMCYSSYGRILMSNEVFEKDFPKIRLNMWMYNPLTKCITRLPESPMRFDHLLISSGCSVVGMSIESDPSFYFINTKEELEWCGGYLREEPEELNLWIKQSNVNVVLVRDFYYLLVEGGNLVYFSMNTDTLRMHCLKQPCDCGSFDKIFLVECDGDLLSIYIGNEWKWVRVFKFEQSELVWEEVKDLKNNNLYVSNISTIVTEVESPEVGNRIYFSRFYQDSIIYYSLNTNKFCAFDGRDSVIENVRGLEDQLYGCWFHPTFK